MSSAYPRRNSAGGRGVEARTMPRSISDANLDKLQYCWEVIMKDFVTNPPPGGTTFFATSPTFTLLLPSLHKDSPEFKKFVYDTLTDRGMQKHLEEGRVLNWCNSFSEVVALNTLRDGNCLLHAVSLAMWGIQDRGVHLRQALSKSLTFLNNTLYQRWKHTRKLENQRMGMELDSSQWDNEWTTMIQQASHNVQIGKNYDSLDDFHVFVLANVIRRPIILYAATKIHSLQTGGTLQEIDFQGVYLPLLWEPTTCKKNPLPLAYDGGHFCALAVTELSKTQQGRFLLPLVDYNGKQLTIKFTLPVEVDTSLVMDYLNPIQIGLEGTSRHILCAGLDIIGPPPDLRPLIPNFLEGCWQAFLKRTGSGQGRQQVSAAETGNGDKMKCINNCGRLGDAEHSFLCMECFSRAKERELETTGNHSPPIAPQDRRNSRDLPDGKPGNPPARIPSKGGGPPSGTVKCPQCGDPGFPQLLGMCERCYGNNINKGNPIYEKLPSGGGQPPDQKQPPSLPLPRNAKDKSLCRKPGCKFYGTIENRFYCSKCFESDMVNILKEADEGPPIRPETPDDIVSPAHIKQLPPSLGSPPPLCYQCQEFFANEDYRGLCNDCFMKSTITGEPPPRPPRHPNSSEHRSCQDADSLSGGYLQGSSRFYNPTTPNPAYGSSRGMERVPESSRVLSNPTAPITKVESKMAEMNVSSGCFMCNNSQMGDFDQFTVCREHAKDMYQLLIQSKKEGHKREDEVRRKPSRGTDPRTYDVIPYEPTQSYGNEVKQKPHPHDVSLPHANEPRRPSFGHNNLDDPQHLPGGPQLPKHRHGAEPSRPSGYETHKRRREVDQSHHAQQSPSLSSSGGQPKYGNEENWPAPPGRVYEDLDGRYRNELDSGAQHRPRDTGRYRNELDDGPRDAGGRYRNQLDDEAQHRHRDASGRYRNELDDVTQHPHDPGKRYRNEFDDAAQHHPPGGRYIDSPQHRRDEQRRQPGNNLDQDYPVQEPQEEGAGGGASGVSAVEPMPRIKSLCAKTGCSFKGYQPLKGLCPDCYVEEYKRYPDFYSPDKFPLV